MPIRAYFIISYKVARKYGPPDACSACHAHPKDDTCRIFGRHEYASVPGDVTHLLELLADFQSAAIQLLGYLSLLLHGQVQKLFAEVAVDDRLDRRVVYTLSQPCSRDWTSHDLHPRYARCSRPTKDLLSERMCISSVWSYDQR
jgi:hypothetical protein